jgi:hypothetical protein
MESWSIEDPRLLESKLLLNQWYKAEHKNRPSSAFARQYSITPPLHHSMGFQTAKDHPFWVKSRSGPMGQDSLLIRQKSAFKNSAGQHRR